MAEDTPTVWEASVLDPEDTPWDEVIFANEAAAKDHARQSLAEMTGVDAADVTFAETSDRVQTAEAAGHTAQVVRPKVWDHPPATPTEVAGDG